MSSLVIWCHLIIISLKPPTFCSFHSTPLYIIRTVFIILCSIKSNLKEFCPFPSCCVIIFHPIPVRSPLLVLQGDINRYITSLGQPCAYMVGEVKIKELRQRAEEALNDGFHLANFHDVVLWWLASLKVVEECVKKSIRSATLTLQLRHWARGACSASWGHTIHGDAGVDGVFSNEWLLQICTILFSVCHRVTAVYHLLIIYGAKYSWI